jgi:hypothetical protein
MEMAILIHALNIVVAIPFNTHIYAIKFIRVAISEKLHGGCPLTVQAVRVRLPTTRVVTLLMALLKAPIFNTVVVATFTPPIAGRTKQRQFRV